MTQNNFTQASTLSFQLPDWLRGYASTYQPSTNLDDRVNFVLDAAFKHIDEKTGGPFAAAVFASETGELISLGVNLVPSEQLSCLHAEVVALTLAQQKLGTYNLSDSSLPKLELITSTEPCAMCLGAIPWSGISRVVCSATGSDAEAIGFDEGDKPEDWKGTLTRRGIEVLTAQLRGKAKQVLHTYQKANGELYNSNQDSSRNDK